MASSGIPFASRALSSALSRCSAKAKCLSFSVRKGMLAANLSTYCSSNRSCVGVSMPQPNAPWVVWEKSKFGSAGGVYTCS